MQKKLARFLLALGAGLLILASSVYVAWKNAKEAPMAWREQSYTQFQLREIDRTIEEYRKQSNSIPRSLSQLQSIGSFVQSEDDGQVLDGWRRPFVYWSDGTNFLVTSYGRDGKPGGKNLDCDLTDKVPKPVESLPTFGEFLHNQRTHGMIVCCVVGAVMAAISSFITVRIPDFSKRGVITLLLSLGATLLGTFLATVIITALHVPSGH